MYKIKYTHVGFVYMVFFSIQATTEIKHITMVTITILVPKR